MVSTVLSMIVGGKKCLKIMNTLSGSTSTCVHKPKLLLSVRQTTFLGTTKPNKAFKCINKNGFWKPGQVRRFNYYRIYWRHSLSRNKETNYFTEELIRVLM